MITLFAFQRGDHLIDDTQLTVDGSGDDLRNYGLSLYGPPSWTLQTKWIFPNIYSGNLLFYIKFPKYYYLLNYELLDLIVKIQIN